MKKSVIDWLLEGEPWVIWRTRIDLLGESASSPLVKKAKAETLSHPLVQGLFKQASGWPGIVLNSHKSAQQTYHTVEFLADLGFTKKDPGISDIAGKMMAHQDGDGPFQLKSNTPQHFGGSGKDEWSWALCDAPVILYSLAKFGYGADMRVRRAAEHCVSLLRENGWPCAVSPNLGKFRGPGKKDDPCPYATLIMTKMLLEIPGMSEGKEVKTGGSVLLDLWEKSREQHPYMFFMGNDFRKLKAPLFWYDILHVADALTRVPGLAKDKRLREMLETIRAKADANGFYTPESIYQVYKEWDFGQKKTPSHWLTFLVERILTR